MARLRLHGLRLPGLRPRRPIPESQLWCRRGIVPLAHCRLCVGRLGDGQAKGRARTPRLRSVQQLRRIDAVTRQALHELRYESQRKERHLPKLNCQLSAEFRL